MQEAEIYDIFFFLQSNCCNSWQSNMLQAYNYDKV